MSEAFISTTLDQHTRDAEQCFLKAIELRDLILAHASLADRGLHAQFFNRIRGKWEDVFSTWHRCVQGCEDGTARSIELAAPDLLEITFGHASPLTWHEAALDISNELAQKFGEAEKACIRRDLAERQLDEDGIGPVDRSAMEHDLSRMPSYPDAMRELVQFTSELDSQLMRNVIDGIRRENLAAHREMPRESSPTNEDELGADRPGDPRELWLLSTAFEDPNAECVKWKPKMGPKKMCDLYEKERESHPEWNRITTPNGMKQAIDRALGDRKRPEATRNHP